MPNLAATPTLTATIAAIVAAIAISAPVVALVVAFGLDLAPDRIGAILAVSPRRSSG